MLGTGALLSDEPFSLHGESHRSRLGVFGDCSRAPLRITLAFVGKCPYLWAMVSQPTGINCPAYGWWLPIGWDLCMPAFVDFHPKHRLFKRKWVFWIANSTKNARFDDWKCQIVILFANFWHISWYISLVFLLISLSLSLSLIGSYAISPP